MVLQLHLPRHRRILAQWLSYADTLLGFNLTFDLLYLRLDPQFRTHLDGRHFLVDGSILAYLHDETRPERTLKNLGPIFRTHAYPDYLLERLECPTHPDLIAYNAADTHNTVLLIAELARRIARDFPSCPTTTTAHPLPCPSGEKPYTSWASARSSASWATAPSVSWKLSSECLRHYSDTMWSTLRLTEAGVPMHRPTLQRLEKHLTSRCARIHHATSRHLDLPLSGPGSGLAKTAFITAAAEAAGVLDHPDLAVTPKQQKVSFSDENRTLVLSHLPGAHRSLRRGLRLAAAHAHAQKLLTSYVFPLLHHRRNRPDDRSSVLLSPASVATLRRPKSRDVWYSWPTWFITPSPFKDGAGAEGGTRQGRITCKNHHHQTDPPLIQAAIRSRFPGGCIVAYDADQIELKTATILSGDAGMLAVYQGPKPDIHGDMAVRLFGPSITADPHWCSGDMAADPRQWGKKCNFLILFRGGPDKLRSSLLDVGKDLPLEECRAIVSEMRRARPGLWRWQDSLIDHVRRTGFLELPFTGQSRFFLNTPRGDGGKYEVNEIVNFPVQCHAGNVTLAVQNALHHLLPPLNEPDPPILMFLNKYDALYFDVHPDFTTQLDDAVYSAVEYVGTHGYWSRLCEWAGHCCPLTFSASVS